MSLEFEDLGQGVFCIDAHYIRPKLACCYLIQEGDQAALVDTGTAHTAPEILELLSLRGLTPEQVKFVIPTHVHLDHAGGSGELMQQLPNARLVVHPYGARHLINPAKLEAGTRAVYGDKTFEKLYGTLKSVAADRVDEATEGLTLDLNGRPLRCIDTPGHARHHLCLWDEKSQGLFTGDTFGIAYKELTTDQGPFMFLPSTPVQFDPESWRKTLNQLMTLNPQRAYLTHYSQIENLETVVEALMDRLNVYEEIARSAPAEERTTQIKQKLSAYYQQQLESLNSKLAPQEIDRLLQMDIELCAQGLDIWLNRVA